MANTYTLIASNTLSSSAASVTFSSIPNTYTDLILKWSARDSAASFTDRPIAFQFNSDTGTNYSVTRIEGTGSTAGSFRTSNATSAVFQGGTTGDAATSNTFANGELYIPSYQVSANKPLGVFTVPETNAATFNNVGMTTNASLWRNTAAITSIVLSLPSAGNFVSGSSFFLYGIKNS